MLSFQSPVVYPTFTPEVVAADINNDGHPDLVTADGSVGVLLGDAAGTFHLAQSSSAGPLPQSLAVGDFNGNGKLDLAIANYDEQGGHVSILLGNGNGTFSAPTTQGTSLPASSVAIATGHMNDDQALDLIVLSDDFFGNHQLSVLLGDGDGNFTHRATYGGYNVGQLRSPVLADFNGDGRNDVAVSDWQQGFVRVFLGNVDGTLQASRDLAVGAGANSVAVGDFNGDGKLDLAATTFLDGRVKVLTGNGDGTFQAAQSFGGGLLTGPGAVEAADITGDGKLDLVVTAGAVHVLPGRGDGSFDPPIRTDGIGGNSIAIADFNRDGRLDVAVNSSGVAVLFNDGNWPAAASLPSISISDVKKAEGNAKTTLFTFTVKLSAASSQAVTVNYATANGTATSGSDYLSTTGTITFAPGETTKTITVTVNGDKQKEADETFFVNLSGAVGGEILDGQGQGTILNDDGGSKGKGKSSALVIDAALEDWMLSSGKKRAG